MNRFLLWLISALPHVCVIFGKKHVNISADKGKLKKNNEHTEIENVVLKEMICNSFLPCL